MYGKLEGNELVYAPKNYRTSTHLILNFDKNVELMKQHGFKEVVDVKPDYNPSTQYLHIAGYKDNASSIVINYVVKNVEPNVLETRVAQLEKQIKSTVKYKVSK